MAFWESFQKVLTWPFGQGDDEESRMEGFELPEWKEDPDYRKTQDYLRELGIDILGGDIPEYYAPIGEIGGAEFENYLNLIKGDIGAGVAEGAAAIGRGRGGLVPEMTGKLVGEATTKARYADYLRALGGREWMFGQGRGITEGVRGTAQTQQAQENQFALSRAGLDYKKRGYLDEYDINQDTLLGETLGDLLGIGVGAGVGFATGGPVGAVAGAMGGVDWNAILEGAAKKKMPTTTTIKAQDKLNLGKIGDYGLKNVDLLDWKKYLN